MRALALIAAAAVLFAGCAAKPSQPAQGPSETSDAALPPGVTSLLEGYTKSIELGPLEGVFLKLDKSNETRTTDEAGYFRFENLAPGDYIVIATKDGFRSKTLRAVVEEERAFQLDFTLEPLPTIQPYYETTPLRGLIECQVHYQASEENPNRPSCGTGADPNAKPTLIFNIGPGAAQFLLEMIWTPRTQLASHLTLSAFETQGSTELAYTHSASTLRVTVSENVVRKFYAQGGEVRTLVQAGPSVTGDEAAADVGLSFQQDYEIHFTVFYHAIGPPTFSALPE
jgi:hypothetical protein